MTPDEVLAILDAETPAPKPVEVFVFTKKAKPREARPLPHEPAAPRISRRTWSKGSARGDGPQKQHGAVVVRRNPVKLDPTPMDHWGRKMERCTCGEWRARAPAVCSCETKCTTCGTWVSSAATAPHVCGGGHG